MVARLGLVASPLHSLAFIPKREVKKERGRKLLVVSILERRWVFFDLLGRVRERERLT